MSVRVEDDGVGTLSIGGARYLLVRPETLAALQKAMEGVIGRDAAECLVVGGRAGGARATAALSGDREARVRRLVEMGAALGWGRFALEALSADRLVVTVERSPFAEAYGPSATPVCHLIRGVLESLAAATLSSRPRVAETQCLAMGLPLCRFETVEPPRANRGGLALSRFETVEPPRANRGGDGGDVSSPPSFK